MSLLADAPLQPAPPAGIPSEPDVQTEGAVFSPSRTLDTLSRSVVTEGPVPPGNVAAAGLSGEKSFGVEGGGSPDDPFFELEYPLFGSDGLAAAGMAAQRQLFQVRVSRKTPGTFVMS